MKRLVRVARQTLVQNRWMSVHEDTTDRGGKPGKYYVVERPDAVIMAIIDSHDQVLFVEQFRYPTSQFSIELPMGGVDDSEEPFGAAVRELREETGVVVPAMRLVTRFRPVPGLTPQIAHVLVGRFQGKLTSSSNTTEAQVEDDILSVRPVPMAEISKLISTGKISDGFTLSAIAILIASSELQI